jgi:cell volume regulation protein A
MTFTPENIFFMGSVLIFASIVISRWGYRFGVPTLLLFLFTGMLFGSDGLGLEFNSHEDAQLELQPGDILLTITRQME